MMKMRLTLFQLVRKKYPQMLDIKYTTAVTFSRIFWLKKYTEHAGDKSCRERGAMAILLFAECAELE